MRKIIISIIILFQYISLHAQVCELDSKHTVNDIPECHNGKEILIFEEKFDDTVLNENVWTIQEGVVRDFEFKKQKAYHSRDNIKLENGMLKIISKKEPRYNQQYNYEGQIRYGDFMYSTGEIWTKSLFSENTIVEARIKLPRKSGLWPAFWMYAESDGEYRELDIFEYYTKDTSFTTNSYYGGNSETKKGCVNDKVGHTRTFYNHFHTYRVVYKEDRIEWFIDGKRIRRIPKYAKTEWYYFNTTSAHNNYHGYFCYNMVPGNKYKRVKSFPEGPMHIILNTAIQVGKDIAPETNFISDTMFVQYVKVYKIQDCEKDVNIDSTILINYGGQAAEYNEFITGKTVNIAYDFNIESNHSLTTIASNEIIMNTETNIETGDNGEFVCKVNVCSNRKVNIMEDYGDVLDSDDDNINSYDCDTCSLNSYYDYVYLYDDNNVVVDVQDTQDSIIITNNLGNIIYSNNNLEEQIMINIENYPIGTYNIKVVDSTSNEEIRYLLTID